VRKAASRPRPVRLAAVAAAAGLAVALSVLGCGGSDSSSSKPPISAAGRRSELVGGGRTGRKSPANPPPKGASLMVREMYRQFPPPEPDPRVSGAAAAIRAGERACAKKTPFEVEEEFYPVAVEMGRVDPESQAGKMMAGIRRLDLKGEVSFTAGQLAADAYKATLRPSLAYSGFQGCIYAMATELERKLLAAEG
jgi:hypothetical protein